VSTRFDSRIGSRTKSNMFDSSDRLSDGRTKRSHDTIVGPTSRTDHTDRPVGPTIGTCKRPVTVPTSFNCPERFDMRSIGGGGGVFDVGDQRSRRPRVGPSLYLLFAVSAAYLPHFYDIIYIFAVCSTRRNTVDIVQKNKHRSYQLDWAAIFSALTILLTTRGDNAYITGDGKHSPGQLSLSVKCATAFLASCQFRICNLCEVDPRDGNRTEPNK